MNLKLKKNRHLFEYILSNNTMLFTCCISLIEERRPTVNELSNQKGITQKASGWKLYHMAAQLEDLVNLLIVNIKAKHIIARC